MWGQGDQLMETLDVTSADGSMHQRRCGEQGQDHQQTYAAGKAVGTAEVVQGNDMVGLATTSTTRLAPKSHPKLEFLQKIIRHSFNGLLASHWQVQERLLGRQVRPGLSGQQVGLEIKMISQQPIHLKLF